MKNNHFHFSKQLQIYLNRYQYLYAEIHEVFKKQFKNRYTKEKYDPTIQELISVKISQKTNKPWKIQKYLKNAGFYYNSLPVYLLKSRDIKRNESYKRISQLLGEIWVTHYEIEYLKLIPEIQKVFEIDDSIKNQLLYAFVNVNYYCFENLLDEFYESVNDEFLELYNNRFWNHYFNSVDVLSILGNNTHFLQKMMRKVMHLGYVKPLINSETKENKK